MALFTKEQQKYLAEQGYEYLDAFYCYAKPNHNVSIKKSTSGEFYIYFTKKPYVRGRLYNDTDGVCLRYFKTLPSIFKIIEHLSGLEIS